MAIFGLATKREQQNMIDAAVKAALREAFPKWALETAGVQKNALPDPSTYEAQADIYRRLSWILAAVMATANAVKLAEGAVMEGEKKIKQHDFEKLLSKPNPMQSRSEILAAHATYKKVTGNSYWWMNRESEKAPPDELWLIPSHMIEPVPDERLYIKGYWYYPGDGQKIPLQTWEIMHCKTTNPFNRFLGLSALESLAIVARGDIEKQEWQAASFRDNNGMPPSVLTFQDFPTNEVWADMKSEFRGAAKKREMIMLRGVGQGAVNLIQGEVMNSKDGGDSLGRIQTRDEIWTVLAPGLASMLETSATEANALAGRATFLDQTVYPELIELQERWNLDLMPSYGEGISWQFDDPRYIDRRLKLEEEARYAETHTVQEIRKFFYNDKPVGDERDDLFPKQVQATSGQPEPPPQEVPPQFQNGENVTTVPTETTSPQMVKAIVELDRWRVKSEKAGKLTVWHPVDLPAAAYEAIKAGESFADVRARLVGKPNPAPAMSLYAGMVLEGIREEVKAIKAAK